MASETWQTVADRLAERMYHHAFCNQHRENEAAPDCPSCTDRSAYRAWEKKSGKTHREQPYRGEVLDVLADHRSVQQIRHESP